MASSDGGGGGGGVSKMKSKPAKTKMTVEEYYNFVCSDTKPNLTCNHINQIIDMHGFQRIHKHKKSELMEALNSIELLDLARSTVNVVDGASADAVLSIADVIKDLKEIKWQECCVTSLEALNGKPHSQQQQQQPPPSPGPKTDSSSALTVASASKSKGKRKYEALTDNVDAKPHLQKQQQQPPSPGPKTDSSSALTVVSASNSKVKRKYKALSFLQRC